MATLAATDPANPYGALVPWPDWRGRGSAARGADRPGRSVVLVDGYCAAWIGRGDRQMLVALAGRGTGTIADRPRHWRASWCGRLRAPDGRRGWLIEEINGMPATATPLGQFLLEAGFAVTSGGLQLRVPRRPLAATMTTKMERCLKATRSSAPRGRCTACWRATSSPDSTPRWRRSLASTSTRRSPAARSNAANRSASTC